MYGSQDSRSDIILVLFQWLAGSVNGWMEFLKSDMSVLTMVGCLSDGWIDISKESQSIFNILHSYSDFSPMVGWLSQWLDGISQIGHVCFDHGWMPE